MAYIGSTPTSQNFISGTDYFSGTGSQTAFTLTRTVNSVNDIEVVINNVVQQPSTAYTLSGTTITFTSAPSSGTNNIYVRYLATTMQSITVPANSITRNSLDSNLQAVCTGRNRIINGAMVIDQRNAGASVTPSDGNYTLDRWKMELSGGGAYSVQQSTTAPTGFANSMLITVTTADSSIAAGDYYDFVQFIEGFNTADLGFGTANAKTVTLSFWVQSSLTGTFSGSLRNSAANRSYPFTYTISSANTWAQISVTIAGDTTGTWVGSTNGRGLCVFFDLGSGSSAAGTANTWQAGNLTKATGSVNLIATLSSTLYITGVQLEEGTQATSFEREAYSVTLQKCQRYYWQQTGIASTVTTVGSGMVYASTDVRCTVQNPVTMRTTPSITFTGSSFEYERPNTSRGTLSTLNSTGRSAESSTLYSGSGTTAGTAGDGAIWYMVNNSTSIGISAEL